MRFLWLKIAINFQKWVYRGMVDIFLFETLKSCPKSLHLPLLHWHSFKFKILVILNVHDVKNQSINEQEHVILERCVNSILYLLKK